MPNVMILVGGREFEVACQAGEEDFLQTAAGLLDKEASVVTAQIGRVPEARMLLMAGLMLADKTAGADEQIRYKEDQIERLEREVRMLKSQGAGGGAAVPEALTDQMAELAARAEAIASAVDEQKAAAASAD